jgi:putative nucleotidyltransferase with HDIG domain
MPSNIEKRNIMRIKKDSIESLFSDIDRCIMEENTPSKYLEKYSNEPAFRDKPFDMLHALKHTEQNPKYHPEGNVWNHTKMVVDIAASLKERSKNPKVLMWAALLHDIGKPPTTAIRKGRLTSYNHDKVGEDMARSFLQHYFTDVDFIEDVCGLVRWHMQMLFVVKQRNRSSIKRMAERVDINEIALLGYCDRMGRTNADKQNECRSVKEFLKMCREVLQMEDGSVS